MKAKFTTDVERAERRVLCVHGGPGMDSSYMAPLNLQSRIALVMYDQNPRNGDVSAKFPSAEESVVELLKTARAVSGDDGPITLLAHSWGTYLAVEAAGQAPDLFQQLILCNPFPLNWDRVVAAADRLASRIRPGDLPTLDALMSEGTEEAGRRLMSLVSYAYVSPRNREVDIRVGRYNPSVNARALGSIEGFDQCGKASQIGAVTTCLYGADDFLLMSDTQELLDAGAAAHVLPGCGHFPFSEARPELERILQQVLETA